MKSFVKEFKDHRHRQRHRTTGILGAAIGRPSPPSPTDHDADRRAIFGQPDATSPSRCKNVATDADKLGRFGVADRRVHQHADRAL